MDTPPLPAAALRSAIAALTPPHNPSEHQVNLLENGKKIAVAMLESGAVGDPTDAGIFFKVEISGSGGLERGPGDGLTVSIMQHPDPDPPPPPDTSAPAV